MGAWPVELNLAFFPCGALRETVRRRAGSSQNAELVKVPEQ
jgi:hypothetical protein